MYINTDSQVYNRSHIEKYFATKSRPWEIRSPLTNKILESKQLIEARFMKETIAEHRERIFLELSAGKKVT